MLARKYRSDYIVYSMFQTALPARSLSSSLLRSSSPSPPTAARSSLGLALLAALVVLEPSATLRYASEPSRNSIQQSDRTAPRSSLRSSLGLAFGSELNQAAQPYAIFH